jgi:hypothetical protein
MKKSYFIYVSILLGLSSVVFFILFTLQRNQRLELEKQRSQTLPLLDLLKASLAQGKIDSLQYHSFSQEMQEFSQKPLDQLQKLYRELAQYQNNNAGILSEMEQMNAQIISLTFENTHNSQSLAENAKRQQLMQDSLVKELSTIQKLHQKAESLHNSSMAMVDSLQRQIKALQSHQKSILRFKSASGVDITYFGSSQNGLASGEGIGFYANGNEYDGAWQAGKKHGYGIYKFPNGERYEGNFHTDKRQGFGKYYWPNGEVYTGYWYNDRRHGEGYITDKSKNKTSSGIWKNDLLDRQTPVEFKN